MRDCSQSRMPLLNRMAEHHLYVCVKISVYPVCILFENWSYFARDDIVCPNKLYLSIHASESPTSYTYTFYLIGILYSFGHSFFSLLSFSLSMVNFEKCNEMKIVERRKNERVTVPIITAVYMNKVKRHVVKVRRRRMMMMMSILLTRSHSWDMKRPEGNNDWYYRFVKNEVIEKKQWENDSWKNTSNFLYDMFILHHEKRKKMTKEKARKAIALK